MQSSRKQSLHAAAPAFGDRAARQLQLYQRAAGKHLEGVMALSLVIRRPRSPGAMAHSRAGSWEEGSKAKDAPGAQRGASFSPGRSRGVRWLQVPSPRPNATHTSCHGFHN